MCGALVHVCTSDVYLVPTCTCSRVAGRPAGGVPLWVQASTRAAQTDHRELEQGHGTVSYCEREREMLRYQGK